MAKTFDEKLRAFAQLTLTYGLGFGQKPRPLYVSADADEHQLSFLPVLAREAYALGSPVVDIAYDDPMVIREQFLHAPEEYKDFIPKHVTARYDELLERDGANLAISANADANAYDDVDPQWPQKLRSANFKARGKAGGLFMAFKQPWSVIATPSVAWCTQLNMDAETLWEVLFEITGANRDDPQAYVDDLKEKLWKRKAKLNQLGIKELHFLGEGTNLIVGLHEKAQWTGCPTVAADGTIYSPNGSFSYEVFTGPDWRTVRGTARVTKTTVASGIVINDLNLMFEDGRISDFLTSSKREEEAYRSLITMDEGAAQLGEVALVGLDSPIAAMDRLFYSVLLDENAACHIATGFAYAGTLEGGSDMSPEELAEVGCNHSGTHHDVMISDENTDVIAHTHDGKEVLLLEGGHWTKDFS